MAEQMERRKVLTMYKWNVKLEAIKMVKDIAESLRRKSFTAGDITKIAKKWDPWCGLNDFLVWKILSSHLGYSWWRSPTQSTFELNQDVYTCWEYFKMFMKITILKGCFFIWMDECSVSAANLNQYTWVKKHSGQWIMRPKGKKAITIIAALSSCGDLYAVLWEGTNRAIEIHNFVV